ncbi:DNA cytosine methyltransferase [Spiroplasma endosymbiont of Lonchoptera lutea]|uniref:DNA cytosine methyltransferase n=1 Tax=Spiroplasma endosymbiont of Lonchoptera lutea TaxID=3066297 RepID=UPI0030CB0879
MKLNIGTVFSGIGAFEQALEKMNLAYNVVFACDNDKYVKQSYFANYDISEENWYNDTWIVNINGTVF